MTMTTTTKEPVFSEANQHSEWPDAKAEASYWRTLSHSLTADLNWRKSSWWRRWLDWLASSGKRS